MKVRKKRGEIPQKTTKKEKNESSNLYLDHIRSDSPRFWKHRADMSLRSDTACSC